MVVIGTNKGKATNTFKGYYPILARKSIQDGEIGFVYPISNKLTGTKKQ